MPLFDRTQARSFSWVSPGCLAISTESKILREIAIVSEMTDVFWISFDQLEALAKHEKSDAATRPVDPNQVRDVKLLSVHDGA